MNAPLLVTGGTGALGPALIAELLAIHDAQIIVLVRPGPRGERGSRRLVSVLNASAQKRSLDRLQIVAGDITEPQLGLRPADAELARTSTFIVHAAADTRFGLAASELHHTNVTGTGNVVSFARQCTRLEQLLFVSTTCVAGTRTGSIGERLEPPPAFVNAYESSKWCAEQLLAPSELPTRIVRLSTCLGDAATGSVHRFGAIHHVMKWMMQGLLPMLPAAEGSRFDVIATDGAARWIARALTRSPNGVEVCHVAAGVHAVAVRDLLDCTVTSLRELIPAWKNRQIEPPAVVDAATFARFERTVTQSGDRLFRQVLASASAFLPALLYPKVFETEQSERVWGGPLPLSDWRTTLHRVLAFGAAGGWRLHPASDYAHV